MHVLKRCLVADLENFMRYASVLSIADRELSRIRAEIAHADVTAISSFTSVKERAAASRAAAYIWLAAILERVVRDALQDTLREITLLALPLRELRLSLFSLVCAPEFDSVSNRNKSASWDSKISLFLRTIDAGPATLSEAVLPLDGGTIRAEHFDTIWLVLGIPSASVPSPLHRIALKELADGRNEVAHGHKDAVTFGRTKVTSDMLRLTQRVDDVITHLFTELDFYIDRKLFIR